jgi:hypothetical protein
LHPAVVALDGLAVDRAEMKHLRDVRLKAYDCHYFCSCAGQTRHIMPAATSARRVAPMTRTSFARTSPNREMVDFTNGRSSFRLDRFALALILDNEIHGYATSELKEARNALLQASLQ